MSAFLFACGGESTALEATEWTLEAIDGERIPNRVEATLRLDAGNTTGSGGCNRFTGSYVLDGDSLTIGPLASTRMSCGPDADRTEQSYFAAIERVVTATVTGDRLDLADASGDVVLTYRAP